MHANSSSSSVARLEPIWQMIEVRRSHWSSPRLQASSSGAHRLWVRAQQIADLVAGQPVDQVPPCAGHDQLFVERQGIERSISAIRAVADHVQRGVAFLAETRVVPQLAERWRANRQSVASGTGQDQRRTSARSVAESQPQVRHGRLHVRLHRRRVRGIRVPRQGRAQGVDQRQRGCSCSSSPQSNRAPGALRCDDGQPLEGAEGQLDERSRAAPPAARRRTAAGTPGARGRRRCSGPSPPPATSAPSVAVATIATAALRTPAMISGAAIGSSTSRSTWSSRSPMPRADSTMSWSTSRTAT